MTTFTDFYELNKFSISLKNKRGGRNIENQNIEGSEHRKFFQDDQNVESQKDHNI